MFYRRIRYLTYVCLAILTLSLTVACGGTSGSTGSTGSSSGLHTVQTGVLTIGTNADSKPYTYIQNGKVTGFDIELITAIAQKLNLKPNFVNEDFSALLPSVKDGQFDCAASAIAITAAREQLTDFSYGYHTGYSSVLTYPGSGITNLASLSGKRIGVLQGSIYDTYANTYIPGAQIVRFPDDNTAFLGLENKTIVGLFNSYVSNVSYQQEYAGLHLEDPVKVSTNLSSGFAVRKGNVAMVDALNKGLEEVVADGTWGKLIHKYFPGQPLTPAPPYKRVKAGP